MMYSRVCLEPVGLSIVTLIHESIDLRECANLEYEKKVFNEVNKIDLAWYPFHD